MYLVDKLLPVLGASAVDDTYRQPMQHIHCIELICECHKNSTFWTHAPNTAAFITAIDNVISVAFVAQVSTNIARFTWKVGDSGERAGDFLSERRVVEWSGIPVDSVYQILDDYDQQSTVSAATQHSFDGASNLTDPPVLLRCRLFTSAKRGLWQLQLELEMVSGDVILFLGGLFTHNSADMEEGPCHIQDCFIHQDLLLWHKKMRAQQKSQNFKTAKQGREFSCIQDDFPTGLCGNKRQTWDLRKRLVDGPPQCS